MIGKLCSDPDSVQLDGLVHLEVQPAFDRGHQAELLRRHDHPLALLRFPAMYCLIVFVW